jgi:hypothetical protein
MSAATIQFLQDEVASLRLRVKALETGQVAEATEKPKKGKTAKAKKETDAEKVKKAPGSWALALQEVYMPIIKKALGEENLPKGIWHMTVASYLKKDGKTAPTEDDVKKAISFLESNPDYKSNTQKSRSEAGSVKEDALKKRGRPAKAKAETEKAEKPVPKVVTPKAEKAADDEEKLSSWDADASDDEKDEEDKEEKPFEAPQLFSLMYKGIEYLRDPEDDELYTSDGDMRWVGTWTGKKIVKGEMSERVKKVLASQE